MPTEKEKATVSERKKTASAAKVTKTKSAKATAAADKSKLEQKSPEKKKTQKAAAAKEQKKASGVSTIEADIIVESVPEEQPAKKGILFVASEAFPYAGTGGLGEVIGSLPKKINQLGKYDARVILPLYESVGAETRSKMHYIGNIYVPLAWRMQYCGLFRLEENGVVYYFVDNEYYFKRNSLYGYGDDGERFAFFSRAVLELLPMLDFTVDVLHCHDWHTALVPIYY